MFGRLYTLAVNNYKILPKFARLSGYMLTMNTNVVYWKIKVVNSVKEPKLEISPKKYTDETTIISMRLPKDMLRDIDAVAKATGRTRNEILSMSMEFALNHIEIINNENQNK